MLKRIAKAFLVASAVTLLVTAPVLAYVYRATYVVTNNTTTSYDMISVYGDINNEWMIANGFIENASANDTRIETLGGLRYPHLVTDNMTLTALTSPSYSQTNLYYTTGNTALASFEIMSGYSGNITASDAAAIEPGDNFTYYTYNAWVDTDAGANKHLIRKRDAIEVYVSETISENISAHISTGGAQTEVLRPDGNSACNLPNEAGVVCPNHFQNVDEAVVNDADWNGILLAAGDISDIYTLDNTSIPSTANITGVELTIRGVMIAGATGQYRGGLRIGGDTTWGTYYNDAVFTTHSENLSRPGGGAWAVSDLNGLLYLANVTNGAGADSTEISWCYVTVYYTYWDKEVNAVGISSGEHDIIVGTDNFTEANTDDDALFSIAFGSGIIPCKRLYSYEMPAAASSLTIGNIDTLVDKWNGQGDVTSKHFVIYVYARSADAVAQRNLMLRFNGDSGANYNYQILEGENAVGTATIFPNQTEFSLFPIPGTTYATAYGGGWMLAPNAFDTSNQLSIMTMGGAVDDEVEITAGRYASTANITSVTLFANTGNLAAGSRFVIGVVDERFLVEEQDLAAPGNVSFTTLPASTGDLAVIASARSAVAATTDQIDYFINNDLVVANYHKQRLYGNAAATGAQQANNNITGYFATGSTATANAYGSSLFVVSQYNGGTGHPNVYALGGLHEAVSPSGWVEAVSSRRANVAAVTRLDFQPNVGANFLAGTMFSLYHVPQEVITRTTLTAPAASISFTSIPQEYEVLGLYIYARSALAAANDPIVLALNADGVAANYDRQYLQGAAAAVNIGRSAANNQIVNCTAATEGAGEYGGGYYTFPDYTDGNQFQFFCGFEGRTENAITLNSFRWENTDAVRSITLTLASANNFLAGTVVELIGIMPLRAFYIDVDNTIRGLEVWNNATVVDNTNQWVFQDGNSAIYSDNISLEVDTVQQLWYQPQSYIIGTNLIDRQGGTYNGTFNWGLNPTAVYVTIGSMVSSGQPSLGQGIDEEIMDMLGDVEVSDWFAEPDVGVGGSLTTNPLRPFVTMLSDNSTLTERQVWVLYGTALLLFVTVGTAVLVRGHYAIVGIICGATIIGLVALTIYPLWALVFTIGAVISGVVAERSPSL